MCAVEARLSILVLQFLFLSLLGLIVLARLSSSFLVLWGSGAFLSFHVEPSVVDPGCRTLRVQ